MDRKEEYALQRRQLPLKVCGNLRIAHTVGNGCSLRSWLSQFSSIIEVCDGSFCPEKWFYLLNDVILRLLLRSTWLLDDSAQARG